MYKSNHFNKNIVNILDEARELWEAPYIEDATFVPTGDMPGDKVVITKSHIQKADVIFPELMNQLKGVFLNNGNNKAVISVHGGSGVGKSEIGSLLAHYLRDIGLGAYVLSGDNYPNRIPKHNDAERLRIYRMGGLKAIVDAGEMNSDVQLTLKNMWQKERDADPKEIANYPWLALYQTKAREALDAYLGSPIEIDFEEVSKIIESFKAGASPVMLKRMGRSPEQVWYSAVDFSEIDILVIEWTHGNNANLKGVDIPILLNSTPQETLDHRKSRNRDNKTDSAFVTTVLELEQNKLIQQAPNAKIIVTKGGEIINYCEFLEMMTSRDITYGPMFNAYPDSIGGRLEDILTLLKQEAFSNTFESV